MSQISYTFLRNNHTKQGRISTWTREQPGTTRKEKMMGDYTEHLISMAGGDAGELEEFRSDMKSIRSTLRLAKEHLALLALVREQAAQIRRVQELAAASEPFKFHGGYTSSGIVLANDIFAALTVPGQP